MHTISLWAQVRDLVRNMIEAQKWAEGIRDCLSKVKNWSHKCSGDLEKVHFEFLDELLSFEPVSCNEPAHLKLKVVMV